MQHGAAGGLPAASPLYGTLLVAVMPCLSVPKQHQFRLIPCCQHASGSEPSALGLPHEYLLLVNNTLLPSQTKSLCITFQSDKLIIGAMVAAPAEQHVVLYLRRCLRVIMVVLGSASTIVMTNSLSLMSHYPSGMSHH